MFVPTSTYPDIWCTPGVVSQTPESATKRRLRPSWMLDVKLDRTDFVPMGLALAKDVIRGASRQRHQGNLDNNMVATYDLFLGIQGCKYIHQPADIADVYRVLLIRNGAKIPHCVSYWDQALSRRRRCYL